MRKQPQVCHVTFLIFANAHPEFKLKELQSSLRICINYAKIFTYARTEKGAFTTKRAHAKIGKDALISLSYFVREEDAYFVNHEVS